jgi:hypothetical protein
MGKVFSVGNECLINLQQKSNKQEILKTLKIGGMTTYHYSEARKAWRSRLLDLVHNDLCGPMPTQAMGDARYL